MRILIAGTAHYPALNGQAVFTENLTEGLAKRGHEILSIFPSEKGHAYQTIRNNVRIEALRSTNLNMLHSDAYFSLFSEKAIRRIFDDFKPEIVHVQDHYPVSRDVVRVARKVGARLMGTNHFMPENLAAFVPVLSNIKPLYNRIMWSWMLDVYNKLDLATAQSKASAAIMRRNGLRIPVFPVSCGINLQHFRSNSDVDRDAVRARFGLDPHRKVFLFVGRVDHEKRLEILLRALSLLNRDDIQLAIAGQGAAQHYLETLANELNLGDRVRFIGFVIGEDLPLLLNSVDIFTMPSEAELLSIASLEAMACGLPLLLADSVALPELVLDGVNGRLFRPGDSFDAARCLSLLADHPEQWASMGAKSMERAEDHGIENTLKKYENIYSGLVSGSYARKANTDLNRRHSPPGELLRSKKG